MVYFKPGKYVKMMCYSDSETGIHGKRNPISPNRIHRFMGSTPVRKNSDFFH